MRDCLGGVCVVVSGCVWSLLAFYAVFYGVPGTVPAGALVHATACIHVVGSVCVRVFDSAGTL